jgi:hypothetical protein
LSLLAGFRTRKTGEHSVTEVSENAGSRVGWLLGHRFLMLTHRGRRTGRVYRTVLEVVARDEVTREAVVMFAFGRTSHGPGGPAHASLTRSIPRWRKEAVARGPVRYFMNAATIGPTWRRRRSVTNEIG